MDCTPPEKVEVEVLVTTRFVAVVVPAPSVPLKEPVPPVTVPMVAVLERRSVVEARPETYRALEVALMKVLLVNKVVEAKSVLPERVVKEEEAWEMRPWENVMRPPAVSAS